MQNGAHVKDHHIPVPARPRSVAQRLRRDAGHMDLEMTFDDPKYYTRPFGFKTTFTLLPDNHMLEYVCTENQKFKDYVAK